MNRFDLIVIGAGSGGIAAAKRARAYGASVALIEATESFGGTCVHSGCIPKKLFSEAALVGTALKSAALWGYSPGSGARFNLKDFKRQRDEYISILSKHYEKGLADAGVEVFLGSRASLVSPREVKIESFPPRVLSASHILIATGSQAKMPCSLDGVEHCISSDSLWEMEELPRRLCIVGGGYIAIETATLMKSLAGPDASVTIIVRQPSELLQGFDSSLREATRTALKESGIELLDHFGNLQRIEKDGSGKLLVDEFGGQKAGPFDCVLLALGRRACTKGLNLEGAGVTTEEKGGSIVVDASHTSVSCPSIHAVGDVAGSKQLTPLAIAAARLKVDSLFGHLPSAPDYCNVPTVLFAKPPIATVGLSEQQAVARFGKDKIVCFSSSFFPLHVSFASHVLGSKGGGREQGEGAEGGGGRGTAGEAKVVPLHKSLIKIVCLRMTDGQFQAFKDLRAAELKLRLAFSSSSLGESSSSSSSSNSSTVDNKSTKAGAGQPSQPSQPTTTTSSSDFQASCRRFVGDIGSGTAPGHQEEPHYDLLASDAAHLHKGLTDAATATAAATTTGTGTGTGIGTTTALAHLIENSRLRVLGIHVHGERADEMIQGFAAFLKRGIVTKADLDAAVAVHPTSAEELVTLQPWQPLDLGGLAMASSSAAASSPATAAIAGSGKEAASSASVVHAAACDPTCSS